MPNQTLQVQLANQPCQLNVYQFAFGLFMDVYVAGTLVIAGVLCQNLNRIVRSAYLGFSGDFAFVDTQGTTDPIYTASALATSSPISRKATFRRGRDDRWAS